MKPVRLDKAALPFGGATCPDAGCPAPPAFTGAIATDTIAAQATPPGRGAVAIVRVSGPQVGYVMEQVLKYPLKPRQAAYLPFYGEQAEQLDRGVAIFFPGPYSFTGEDILELQGHGGPVVVDWLLQRLLRLGVRLARPGEFSERAFLNNKIDLVQAEAIADLINASSQQAARSAMRSLQGMFSQDIHDLNEKIIHLRLYIEAAIDFSDEEIDFMGDNNIVLALQQLLKVLAEVQKKAKQGSLLRDGITAVIAGEPNVGKSSLLNGLSGKDLAIVAPVPGTTRDLLRDHILLDGMPIHIIDTAGLRKSEDSVEQEGIRRAYQEIERADLVLYVVDANDHPAEKITVPVLRQENSARSARCLEGQPALPIMIVRNKIDLVGEGPAVLTMTHQYDGADHPVVSVVSLSAKTGAGLDLLKQQIKIQAGHESSVEGEYLARRRHLDALARAGAHVQNCLQQLSSTRFNELAAEDLRLAHAALCEMTGEFSSDDLLGRIFSSFCIGK